MGDGFYFLDIVLFAMVAAFLVLRLRSVLGKRTGHEQPRQDPISQRNQETEADGNVVELPNRQRETDPMADLDPDDPLTAGISEIREADGSFDPGGFANGRAGRVRDDCPGLRGKADRDNLQMLLAEDVYENFESRHRRT